MTTMILKRKRDIYSLHVVYVIILQIQVIVPQLTMTSPPMGHPCDVVNEVVNTHVALTTTLT